jgi:hypothetical protein
MSFIDKVKEAAMNQFIEVIEWLDGSQDTLLYRFPVAGQEIKNGAQLIVRESQADTPSRAATRRYSRSWVRGNTASIRR